MREDGFEIQAEFRISNAKSFYRLFGLCSSHQEVMGMKLFIPLRFVNLPWNQIAAGFVAPGEACFANHLLCFPN